MKRTVFSLGLILLLLVSCGKETDIQQNDGTDARAAVGDTDAVTVTENVGPCPAIPDDLDFGGAEFRLLTGYYNDYCKVTRDEENGEVLNDAIYKMQKNTEERLHVKIEETREEWGTSISLASALVASGDNAYDAMNQILPFTINMMVRGELQTMDDVPYLDLTAPWWNPNITEALSIGGNTFYAASASNLLLYADTACIFINPAMAAALDIDTDQLYRDVQAGRWTLDMMMRHAKMAVKELNGDGKMDERDQWGLTSFDDNSFATAVIASGDAYAIGKNKENALIITWEDSRYQTMIETAYDMFHTDSAFFFKDDRKRLTADIFMEGRSLYMQGYFLAVDTLKDMNDDYVILPIPKYEETQDAYHSATYDTMTYCLPKFVQDTEMFGAVLEWLSYEGKQHVQDAYIETTMKYKNARNSVTADMVQLCLDSCVTELGNSYCRDYCDYDAIYNFVIKKPSFKFASFAQSMNKRLTKRLSEIQNAVQNQD